MRPNYKNVYIYFFFEADTIFLQDTGLLGLMYFNEKPNVNPC